MKRPALAFVEIEVRRMPGFPRGGLRLPRLSPGVNLVHGPNASGKSTAARALLALLWPPRAPGPSFAGAFAIDGSTWRVDVDSGRLEVERDGVGAELPPLPPAEVADRYLLALDRLLSVDDAPLAAEILRESAGGYDLAAAAAAAGCRERASDPRKAREDLEQAERRVDLLQAEQERLQGEEGRLAALAAERARAAAARDRAALLAKALELARAQGRVSEWAERLAAFPAVLAQMAGDEAERLARDRRRLDELGARCREAAAQAARLSEELARAGLPPGGLARGLAGRLETYLDELLALKQTGEAAALGLASAREAARQALGELDPEGDAARFRSAGPIRVAATFDDLLAQTDRLRAAEAIAQRLRRRVTPAASARTAGAPPPARPGTARLPDSPPPAEGARLREGVRQLSRWLSAPRPAPLLTLALVAGALALFGSAFLLSQADPAAWAAAGAAGLGLLAAAGWQLAAGRRRAVYARDYRRTGLPAPASWQDAEVEGLLARLEAELGRALEIEVVRELAAELGVEEPRLAAEAEALAARRREVAASLGLAPDLSALSLALLAGRLGTLEAALVRAAEAEARLAEARRQDDAVLARLAELLARFGYPAPADRAAARGAVQDLLRRADEVERASAHLAEAERDLAQNLRPEIAATERRLAELLARVGLTAEDAPTLEAWTADLPAFRKAALELRLAERERDALRPSLARDPELLAIPVAELAALKEEAEVLARSEAALAETIGAIRSRVESARTGHELEAALARRDACREALAARRFEDYEAVAGWLLSEQVRRQAGESSLSPVLARAREIFARITRDRYQLLVEDGDRPSFRARDSLTSGAHALEELSSGSRVQLLLATRLGFIESQEHGLALPLILDEALATSDEARAAAVIDAVAELARAGRQVVCFTAQESEVATWVERLRRLAAEGRPVEHRVIDLVAVLRADEAERRPLPPPAPPRPPVPAPGGLDHEAYGRLLGVPGIDPWAPDLGGVHLWHLLDDPQSLHALLAQGLERWGQARGAAERGLGEALAPGGSPVIARAEAAARALEAAVAAWKVGRGRPIDRGVLLASGAVSDAFLDQVDALAREVDGDARALTERLRVGEVKGFRSAKLQDLERFLDQEGYLDRRPVLAAEELSRRVLAASEDDLAAARLSRSHLDRLLRLLPG